MANEDVRWKQRYTNFRNAVSNLQTALLTEEPNMLERQGLIKAFELCYELAWKTLQDYLREIGYVDVSGPKPVIRRAFEAGIIHDGQIWSDMHQARNESTHVYSQEKAETLEAEIRGSFADVLAQLATNLEKQL